MRIVKRLSERVLRMRKTVSELQSRLEAMSAASAPHRKAAAARLESVRLILSKISPKQARLMLRRGIVVAVVRGVLWERAVYGKSISEEALAKLAAWGDENYLRTIKADLARTFPRADGFQAGGRYLPRLEKVLRAYAGFDKIRYVQGMNSVAGMACLAAQTDSQAYAIYKEFMLGSFYGHRHMFERPRTKGTIGFPLACKLGWILDRLMEKYHPELALHLNKTLDSFHCSAGIFSGVNVAYMSLKWFMTLFASVFPGHLALRIYDSFVTDGHVAVLRIAMLTIEERKADFLALPVGDLKIIQPRQWHNLDDDEVDPSSTAAESKIAGEPRLRPLWRQDPDEILAMAAELPPSCEEYSRLNQMYEIQGQPGNGLPWSM